MLSIRKRPVGLFLRDSSLVVTALIFALCIPAYSSWWIAFSGMAFAIIIAKHCYGGIGQNIFNPAMAGYVFVLLCFPSESTSYVSAFNNSGLIESLKLIAGLEPAQIDSITGATALTILKTGLDGMNMVGEIRESPVFGLVAGHGREWIALTWLLGGIWLIYRKLVDFRLPLVFIGTMFVVSTFFYWLDDSRYISPLFTLFAGGSMLAAFFIITDPVSSSTTPVGKIIFAAGTAVLAYIIRTWSNYPDGIAFAVLLMNFAVPLIDRFTRPRVLGEDS